MRTFRAIETFDTSFGKTIYIYILTLVELSDMLGVRQAVLASLPRVGHVSHVSSRTLHVSRLAAAIQIKMPSLSPTMEEGTIVKWAKVCLYQKGLLQCVLAIIDVSLLG